MERVCQLPTCGRVFHVPPSKVKTGRGKYHSVRCANAAMVGRPYVGRRVDHRGEENPAFKNWATRNKRAYVNRFRAKYPEKAAAHDAVKNALARGVLVRPAACERCHAVGKTDVFQCLARQIAPFIHIHARVDERQLHVVQRV